VSHTPQTHQRRRKQCSNDKGIPLQACVVAGWMVMFGVLGCTSSSAWSGRVVHP
jgi:hypothetical protein